MYLPQMLQDAIGTLPAERGRAIVQGMSSLPFGEKDVMCVDMFSHLHNLLSFCTELSFRRLHAPSK